MIWQWIHGGWTLEFEEPLVEMDWFAWPGGSWAIWRESFGGEVLVVVQAGSA